jgi:hypothetical protein
LFLDNFIHNNHYLSIQQFVHFVNIAGKLFEFFFDLPFDKLNFAAIDLALVDISGQLTKLFRKGDDLSTIELNLTQLMLSPIIKQFLSSFSVCHKNYLMSSDIQNYI